jgi:glycosyltransferase involved in cell wall biosynthesis
MLIGILLVQFGIHQFSMKRRAFRSEGSPVVWHIITGEYPPQLGGVSDYTYQISRELAKHGDSIHLWSPATESETFHRDSARFHALPRGFGRRWLRDLDRRLRSYSGPRNILIQYVPHMYGWKSMNLAFCWWIFRQRKQNVCVMFHEVAFPLRSGQPLRHSLLSLVHRFMAWIILRSARHSFTSTDPYIDLLRSLGNRETPISMLRICSNIPMESYGPMESYRPMEGYRPMESYGAELPPASPPDGPRESFTVGVFSNFSAEVCGVLEPAIGCLLENPKISVVLLGPGEAFRKSLALRFPQAADRIGTTGRLQVADAGQQMQRCNALLQLYPDGASAARGTLIGSLASGVPVVTSAGPQTDSLLLDSAAMLFADGSPQSIRDAIELLRDTPTVARELGVRARRLYQDFFQPAVIVSKLRDAMGCSHPVKELEVDEDFCPADSRLPDLQRYGV